MTEKNTREEEQQPVDPLEEQIKRLQNIYDEKVVQGRQQAKKDEDDMAKKKKKKHATLPKEETTKDTPISVKEEAPPEDHPTPENEIVAEVPVREETETIIDETPPPEEAPPEEQPDAIEESFEVPALLDTSVQEEEPVASPSEALEMEQSLEKHVHQEEPPAEQAAENEKIDPKAVIDENGLFRELLTKNRDLMAQQMEHIDGIEQQLEEALREVEDLKQEKKEWAPYLQRLEQQNAKLREVLFGQVQNKLLEFVQIFKTPEVSALLEKE